MGVSSRKGEDFPFWTKKGAHRDKAWNKPTSAVPFSRIFMHDFSCTQHPFCDLSSNISPSLFTSILWDLRDSNSLQLASTITVVGGASQIIQTSPTTDNIGGTAFVISAWQENRAGLVVKLNWSSQFIEWKVVVLGLFDCVRAGFSFAYWQALSKFFVAIIAYVIADMSTSCNLLECKT